MTGNKGPAGWIYREGGFFSVCGIAPFASDDTASVLGWTEPPLRGEVRKWLRTLEIPEGQEV